MTEINTRSPSLAPEHSTASPSGASRRGSHQLAAAISCERLWAFRYGLRIRNIVDPPWRLGGTLIHTCLAYHYAAKMDDPPGWFREKNLTEALAEEGKGHPDIIRLALEVSEEYKERFTGEPWRPVAVEEEYVAKIGELDPGGYPPTLDDEIISCRTDLVVESNGQLWIVDHKTQSGGWRKDGRLERWRDDGEYLLNWQVMCNLHILRKRFAPRPVAGFLINRIKRRPPWDFDRHPLRVPALAYRDAPRTARSMVARELFIEAKRLHGQKPIPNFAACMGRFGPCDYRDICAADTKEEQNHILSTQFTKID